MSLLWTSFELLPHEKAVDRPTTSVIGSASQYSLLKQFMVSCALSVLL